LTQYIPLNYRSLAGDTVRVTYQEVWEDSGKVKRAVLQLAPISIPDTNKPLSNPVQGEIVGVGKGSSRHSKSFLLKVPDRQDAIPIYIPFGSEAESLSREDVVGAKVEISSRRVPIIRGNAYLYEAEKVSVVGQ
jgi:hypothetical protein